MNNTILVPLHDPHFLLVESNRQNAQRIADTISAILDSGPIYVHELTEIGLLEDAAAVFPSLKLIVIRKEMFIFGCEGVGQVLEDLERIFGEDDRPPGICLISSDLTWNGYARSFFDRYSGEIAISEMDEIDFTLSQLLLEESKSASVTRSP